MRIAGGIVAIIAGLFAVFAGGATVLVGGVGGAFDAEGAGTVVGLGFGGVLFAFLTIILGAVAVGVKSRIPGTLLILTSLAGAILGGTLVAIFMVLALFGGILVLIGGGRPKAEVPA